MENLKNIVSKMDLEKPSLSFTNNVMRTIETKEIKWTLSYFVKFVFPFVVFGILIVSVFILNLLGYRMPGLIDLLPINLSTYIIEFNYYEEIFSIGISTIFTALLFLNKQLKNKYIKL